MKVAVSANGRDLEASIDPRFGRCANFIIVDTDTMRFEVVDNESAALAGGAGIQAAQAIASQGAAVLITGNVGPNAVRTLSAAGIRIVTGQAGTVREAVEAYKAGGLNPSDAATVSGHYGMGENFGGADAGKGRGMGSGAGMGRGMGRGRGMGGGKGMGGGGRGMRGGGRGMGGGSNAN